MDDLKKSDATDREVIRHAQELDAIFITQDMDFSNIITYPPADFKGIIVIRSTPQTIEIVHGLLRKFIEPRKQDSIVGSLVVIDSHHIRIKT